MPGDMTRRPDDAPFFHADEVGVEGLSYFIVQPFPALCPAEVLEDGPG